MKATRGTMITVAAVVVIATFVAVVLISAESERHDSVAVEVELAEPFLALDDNAEFEAVPADVHRSAPAASYVTYETDDTDAMVEQVKSLLRTEGWRTVGADGTEWEWAEGGPYSHRSAKIFIGDREVRLFIGRIEG